jgi:hypothetical protein
MIRWAVLWGERRDPWLLRYKSLSGWLKSTSRRWIVAKNEALTIEFPDR